MSERPTCKTCAYWCQGNQIVVGTCRKDTPMHDEDAGSVFPQTHKNDWCGQHPQFAEWLESQKTTSTNNA